MKRPLLLPLALLLCAGLATADTLPSIGFESDPSGTPLVPGQIIDTEYAGIGIQFTTHDPVNHPAMIFDSGNPTGGDTDLGSPNEAFGGPGVGAGGATNTTALGNVLIISEDGNSSNPDDNAAGGTILATFDAPLAFFGVDVLDIDRGETYRLRLFSPTGSLLYDSGAVPGLGNNSYMELDTVVGGVGSMEFILSGSGALARVHATIPEPMTLALFLAGILGLGVALIIRRSRLA